MNAKSNQDEEQLASLRIKFPRGGILSILEKHPTLLSKCKYFNYMCWFVCAAC